MRKLLDLFRSQPSRAGWWRSRHENDGCATIMLSWRADKTRRTSVSINEGGRGFNICVAVQEKPASFFFYVYVAGARFSFGVNAARGGPALRLSVNVNAR